MLRRFIDTLYKMLFGFNILASLLLLCVYLAQWIPPSSSYWIAAIAIGYPYIFFANLLFALWWLYRRKRYFYLPLLVLVLGFNHFLNFWGFNWFDSQPSKEAIQVMSYNVRYFNATISSEETVLRQVQRKVLSTIQEQAIDILLGQEFTGKTAAHNQEVAQFLSTEMGLKYFFQGGKSSLAIFSKYPIIKKGTIDFENSYNGAIYADLQYPNKIIRVYSFHLQSIRLGTDEQEIFNKKNLSSLNEDQTQKKYKRINNKLKDAFLRREEQANFIAQHIQNSPYPVLVCGDMNDTPSSFAYHQLSYGLTDAFRAKGAGFGSTYAGLLPLLRIDYIFTDPSIRIESFQVLPNTTSDHYAIYAHLTI